MSVKNLKSLKKGMRQNILETAPGPGAKKGVGRKPLPEDEKRSQKVAVYLTQGEIDRLKETSENFMNISLSKLIVALLKKHGEL